MGDILDLDLRIAPDVSVEDRQRAVAEGDADRVGHLHDLPHGRGRQVLVGAPGETEHKREVIRRDAFGRDLQMTLGLKRHIVCRIIGR